MHWTGESRRTFAPAWGRESRAGSPGRRLDRACAGERSCILKATQFGAEVPA